MGLNNSLNAKFINPMYHITLDNPLKYHQSVP